MFGAAVEPGGVDLDEHLLVAGFGDGDVADVQDLGGAVPVWMTAFMVTSWSRREVVEVVVFMVFLSFAGG